MNIAARHVAPAVAVAPASLAMAPMEETATGTPPLSKSFWWPPPRIPGKEVAEETEEEGVETETQTSPPQATQGHPGHETVATRDHPQP